MRQTRVRSSVVSPKIPKLRKPKLSDLRNILSGYITASEAERVNALAKAALWYEDGSGKGALAYVLINRLAPAIGGIKIRKMIEKAELCRQRAAGTPFLPERDTALRMAIHHYEAICEKLDVPKLSGYIEKFEQQEKQMLEEEAELQRRFGPPMAEIGRALGLPLEIMYCSACNEYKPKSHLNGCETKHASNLSSVKAVISHLLVTRSRNKVPRTVNLDEHSLKYDKMLARLLSKNMRREGMLPVILRELPEVVKYSATERSADGKQWISNRDKHLAFQLQALSNLEKWLKSNESPNRLVKKGARPLREGQPVRRPRSSSGGRSSREKVEALSKLVLQAIADGKWYTYKDLEAKLGVNSVGPAVRFVSGQLEIDKKGSSLKFKLKKGGKK